MTTTIADKVSAYVKDYQVRNGISRKEMAGLVDLSVTSIGRLEDSSDGLAFRNLVPIAMLEFDSLSEFFKAIEDSEGSPTPEVSEEKTLDRLKQTLNAGEFEEFLEKADALDSEKSIGHRFAWSIRLLNLLLSGSGNQLIEVEISALNFYLNNIDEHSKKAKTRISSLLRHRFKY